jgi:two-component sensor histidine kinase
MKAPHLEFMEPQNGIGLSQERAIPAATGSERKMQKQSAEFDLDESGLALLLGEIDHRIRNLLMMIETAVKQTHSTSVEDYRAKLIARIIGLYGFCVFTSHYGRVLGLSQLLEQTVRSYSANGAQVLAAGPDVELGSSLARVLHLVFHELATNANKYGALSSPLGYVKIEWKVRYVPGSPRKLALVWTEHGGPEVKRPRHYGFGSRLIKTVLGGHGGVRLDFNRTGLACFMLVDLDRPDARVEEPAGALREYGSQPHSHSMRY